MLPILFAALAIIIIFVATYAFFSNAGPLREGFSYTKEEKVEWNNTVAPRLGSKLIIANLLGTITSFATTLFFFGQVPAFGIWTFACAATLVIGGLVTVWSSRRLLAAFPVSPDDPARQELSVIARAFWDNTRHGISVARTIKWVSLINISAILWLEFSLFAVVTTSLLGITSLPYQVAAFFLALITILQFTTRFGLRGLIFADLLHAPVIAVASFGLFIIFCLTLPSGSFTAHIRDVLSPHVNKLALILFMFHLLILNGCQILVTETHWLRLWLFGTQEQQYQIKATSVTAGLWMLMIGIGVVVGVFAITTQAQGDPLTAIMQRASFNTYGLASFVFWLAATAALFSTADALLYTFGLVSAFDPQSGVLTSRRLLRSSLSSRVMALSLTATAVFAIVRYFNIPLEALVRSIIPLPLVMLPAVMMRIFDRRVSVIPVLVAIISYSIVSIIGFGVVPGTASVSLYFNLGGPIVPFVIAVVTTLCASRIGAQRGSDVSND